MFLNSVVIFCYGEGGHAAQMNRLAPDVVKNLNLNVISFSDVNIQPSWSSEHYVASEFRGKYSHKQVLTNTGPFKIISTLMNISKKYKVRAVITTGPGIGVLSALYFKVKGAKVIHVETWSRFSSYSFTGKLMYRISDIFYVQNRSLLSLYPKAIYSGLL